MSKYYEGMPKCFIEGVNTIKKYCQFEDCDVNDCDECPYPLSVIRCGEGKEVKDEK